MKKKTASLISFILLGVFVLISFVPYVFELTYWSADIPGVGIYSKAYTVDLNMISALGFGGWLTLLLAMGGIAMLVLQFVRIKSGVIRLLTWMAPLSALVYFISSAAFLLNTIPDGDPVGTATAGKYGYSSPDMGYLFFVQCALMLAVSALSVMIILGIFKDPKKHRRPAYAAPAAPQMPMQAAPAKAPVQPPMPAPVQVPAEPAPAKVSEPIFSVAEELKIYQDMLLSGVITQEEYEAKRKEIIGH